MSNRVKNIFWIILGVVGMGLLIYLSMHEDSAWIHAGSPDSIKVVLENKGFNYDGEIPHQDYVPASPKRKASEDFKGKKFHECLIMVSEWPDAKIIDMGDGKGGETFIDVVVNHHHHYLSFSEDYCQTDQILKDK